MICPWCNTEYPIEFFEVHHKNHIHNDDSDGNTITICLKCHKRHHSESGYDTVILKKDQVSPRTITDDMIAISREEFLKAYRQNQYEVFKHITDKGIEELMGWVDNGASTPYKWGVRDSDYSNAARIAAARLSEHNKNQ
jgi:Zn-finger protein